MSEVQISFGDDQHAFSNFVFRGITRDDIPQLKQLQDSVFPIQYTENFYDSLFQDNAITLLAFDGAKLAGVVTGRIETSTTCSSRKREGYIPTLGMWCVMCQCSSQLQPAMVSL
eukprot:TRINITY_DN16159_c0_g1_i1.p1 TRINITY_DN16159_c0_g1~~TRINITY_DN16159_c0_g1_i1.p1  ORF type:complete len:114 (-),score=7.22 TRINITY_DN16159_c0_g1_i1:19-360(-)